MLHLNEAVIVEGKYDKIRLESLIEATIVTTNGFGVFKDRARMAYIRALAETRGVIILTDSDQAGFMIRAKLSGALPKSQVKHAYIPDKFGKERRKPHPSAEGKVGVEGMSEADLLAAFTQAGLATPLTSPRARLTKADLYGAALTGAPNAKFRRTALLRHLNLPENMPTNAMLQALNALLPADAWPKILQEI